VSYKRQTQRLTNENDALIQQMESLEVEMKRKEDEMSRKQIVIFIVTLLICTEMENYGTVCVCVCLFLAIILDAFVIGLYFKIKEYHLLIFI
jgi:hypothetical protein